MRSGVTADAGREDSYFMSERNARRLLTRTTWGPLLGALKTRDINQNSSQQLVSEHLRIVLGIWNPR